MAQSNSVSGTLCHLFSSPADPERSAAPSCNPLSPGKKRSPGLEGPQTSHAAPENEQPALSCGSQTGVFISRLFLPSLGWFSAKDVSVGSFILLKYTESLAPRLHKVSGSYKMGGCLSGQG